jgi:hypothetical protein
MSASSAEPVFLLTPPGTFSWLLCAQIGRHPQAYGMPELHLFLAETVGEWRELCRRQSFDMDHGLVRAVAQLYFGEQTDEAASRARGWLRRRAHLTTGMLFEQLAERLDPLVPIERSPSLVHRAEPLRRILDMFPGARFVHVVSHPRTYGETVVDALGRLRADGDLSPTHWLAGLASPQAAGPPDPQTAWLAGHRTILEFLGSVPDGQRTTVRGEDLLSTDEAGRRALVEWLHLRDDAEAVACMRHPERSPYAGPGPPSALFGSDLPVFGDGAMVAAWLRPHSLDGELEWRPDGVSFAPEVVELARQFGYQ